MTITLGTVFKLAIFLVIIFVAYQGVIGLSDAFDVASEGYKLNQTKLMENY